MAVDGNAFVAEVRKFLGDWYSYGSAGPTTFDCSGLVQYGLQQVGVKNVPRTSEAQWAWTQHIGYSQLQPGDLVFSQWPGDDASPGHVAIYIGGGQMIEAPHTGAQVHTVALDSGYQKYVVGYGRVPGAATIAGGGTANSTTGIVDASNATSASWYNPLSWFSGITNELGQVVASVFGPVANAFINLNSALGSAMRAVLWLVNPANWVRIIAGIVGFAALVAGLIFVAKAA
jgi:hypothetical protein